MVLSQFSTYSLHVFSLCLVHLTKYTCIRNSAPNFSPVLYILCGQYYYSKVKFRPFLILGQSLPAGVSLPLPPFLFTLWLLFVFSSRTRLPSVNISLHVSTCLNVVRRDFCTVAFHFFSLSLSLLAVDFHSLTFPPAVVFFTRSNSDPILVSLHVSHTFTH